MGQQLQGKLRGVHLSIVGYYSIILLALSVSPHLHATSYGNSAKINVSVTSASLSLPGSTLVSMNISSSSTANKTFYGNSTASNISVSSPASSLLHATVVSMSSSSRSKKTTTLDKNSIENTVPVTSISLLLSDATAASKGSSSPVTRIASSDGNSIDNTVSVSSTSSLLQATTASAAIASPYSYSIKSKVSISSTSSPLYVAASSTTILTPGGKSKENIVSVTLASSLSRDTAVVSKGSSSLSTKTASPHGNSGDSKVHVATTQSFTVAPKSRLSPSPTIATPYGSSRESKVHVTPISHSSSVKALVSTTIDHSTTILTPFGSSMESNALITSVLPLLSVTNLSSTINSSPSTTISYSDGASTQTVRLAPSTSDKTLLGGKTTESHLPLFSSCYCRNASSSNLGLSSKELYVSSINTSIARKGLTVTEGAIVSSCLCSIVSRNMSNTNTVNITSTALDYGSFSVTPTKITSAIAPTASQHPGATTCLWGSLNCNHASDLTLSWRVLIACLSITITLCNILHMLYE